MSQCPHLHKGTAQDTSPIVSAVASLKHSHTVPTESNVIHVTTQIKTDFYTPHLYINKFVHEINWIGDLPCLINLWHWELDAVLSSVTLSSSHSLCPSLCKTSNDDNNNYLSDKKVVKYLSLMFVSRF